MRNMYHLPNEIRLIFLVNRCLTYSAVTNEVARQWNQNSPNCSGNLRFEARGVLLHDLEHASLVEKILGNYRIKRLYWRRLGLLSLDFSRALCLMIKNLQLLLVPIKLRKIDKWEIMRSSQNLNIRRKSIIWSDYANNNFPNLRDCQPAQAN